MMYRPTDAEVKEALDILKRVTTKWPQVKTDGIENVINWLGVGAPSPDMIEARRDLKEALERGESVLCPCCEQINKVYRRTIHAGMVVQLIRLYKATARHSSGWVPVGEIYGSGGSGDYAKLRFWNLIEAIDQRTATDNASGLWRLTSLGEDFVLQRASVPKYVYVYNNRKVGEDGSVRISVKDALQDKFDYSQLMGV